jgi:hypothetical protein
MQYFQIFRPPEGLGLTSQYRFRRRGRAAGTHAVPSAHYAAVHVKSTVWDTPRPEFQQRVGAGLILRPNAGRCGESGKERREKNYAFSM